MHSMVLVVNAVLFPRVRQDKNEGKRKKKRKCGAGRTIKTIGRVTKNRRTQVKNEDGTIHHGVVVVQRCRRARFRSAREGRYQACRHGLCYLHRPLLRHVLLGVLHTLHAIVKFKG